MVFETDESRERLVAELQRLRVHPELIGWVGDPANDVSVLSSAAAVPWWTAVLRDVEPVPGFLGEPAFELALQAHLEAWTGDVERQDLFLAAHRLAQAAWAHRAGRLHDEH